MLNDLVRLHHADYQEDLPFWISQTEPGLPVLELGCGHGRVALPLQAQGRDVYGLDLDPLSLDFLMGSIRIGKIENIHLVQGSMLNIPFQTEFGSVIIPCNTFSTFTSEERTRILEQIYQLLDPRGTFTVSLPNPLVLLSLHLEIRQADSFPEMDLETSFPHPATGYPVQVSSRMSSGPASLFWFWIYDLLYPDGKIARYTQAVEHHLASLELYLAELTQAGFKSWKCWGDFDENPFEEGSDHLILKAYKSQFDPTSAPAPE